MFKSRKVIAFILMLAMILPMFNVGIFAADTDASGETPTEEPKPVSSEPTYPKKEDGTFDDTAGWAYYEDVYVDKNGDVFESNTVVATTVDALGSSGFYPTLNKIFKADNPSGGSTQCKQIIKHLVIDLAEKKDIPSTSWTYFGAMDNLQTLTIRNAGTISGPPASNKLKVASYTIENSDKIDRHENFSFAEGGKLVVKDCGSISQFAFTSGTKNQSLSKAIPGLTVVEIENVTTISKGAFCGNDKITNLSILYTDPDVQGTIEDFAFYKLKSLQHLTFNALGCKEINGAFDEETGTSETEVELENFDKNRTTYEENPFFDKLNDGNPFKETELTEDAILGLYSGRFNLKEMPDPLHFEPGNSFASSKVGADLETQITKSASWTSDSDSTAKVELKFGFNKKPGHDYLILLDVSKSSGEKWGDYSLLNVYKSFVSDIARALLDDAESYDNRLGIISFVDADTDAHPLKTLDFTKDSSEVKKMVFELTVANGNNQSQTRGAFDKAVEMINGRGDQSREVEVILISDGHVSIEEYSENEGPNLTFKPADREAFRESLKALDALGVNIYCIAPIADNYSNTELVGNEKTFMLKVASEIPKSAIDESGAHSFETYDGQLLYSAHNPEGFAEAIQFVLDHIITEYVITDPVDPRFTVDADSIVASDGMNAELWKDEEGRQFITWTIYGLPYQEYTLNFTETLNDPEYDPNSYGKVETNYGYAQVDEVGGEAGVNRVESPVLPRPLPEHKITIYYLEEGTNATVPEEGNNLKPPTVESVLRFEGYEYNIESAPKEIGDYFFTGNYDVDGVSYGDLKFDPETGVIGDHVIILYYQHKYEITVQPNGDTVEYNGTNQSVSGFETLEFEVVGETYTITGLTAGASGRNVGTYNVVVTGEPKVLDANGTDVTRKFIVHIGTATLEITKRNVTFKSETLSKVYDGDPLYAGGEITKDGLVESDEVTFTFDNKSIVRPGTLTEGNSFKYFWEDTVNAQNYNVTVVYGDLEITNGAYEITVQPNGGEFDYDGTEHSVSGFETLTFTVNDKTYTVEGLTAGASGTDAGTYDVEITGQARVLDGNREDVTGSFTVHIGTATLTVNPIEVVVKANDKSKVYGNDDPELDAVVDGLVAGDTIDYTLERVPGEDVGEYTITVTGESEQGNYTVKYVDGTLTIDPRPVTITANDQTKVYGDDDPELTAVVEGTLGDDTVEYVVGRVPGEDVGEYTITPTGAGTQGNYTVSYVIGTLTITPRTVTVVPNDDGKIYGENDPILTAEVEGIVRNDRIDYTLEREDGEDVGEYIITASGATEQGNYIVEYETAVFTINPRPVTVTAVDNSKIYGDDDPELEVQVEGLVESEIAVYAANANSEIDYTLEREPGENVGEYAITVTGEKEQGNYILTYVDGTFTIKPRQVTVTANDQTKEYGEADPELTAEVEGLLDSDTVDYDTAREPGEDPGEYAIMPAGDEEQGNYVVEYVNGTLTITAPTAPVTYTVTVHYVDTDGEEIQESDVNKYNEGDSYTVTAPAIEGYEFRFAVGDTEGTVNGDIEITLVYGATEPSESEPEESEPAETEPAETEPAETEPAETEPAETEPAETEPAETEPAETEPAETEPAETEPAETEPAETEPAETEPAETEPAETEPAETEPAETEPAETEPAETEPEPVIDITDPDVPLADTPFEPAPAADVQSTEPVYEDIPDADVPLGEDAVPTTGDISRKSLWTSLMSISGLGIMGMIAAMLADRKKSKKEDED